MARFTLHELMREKERYPGVSTRMHRRRKVVIYASSAHFGVFQRCLLSSTRGFHYTQDENLGGTPNEFPYTSKAHKTGKRCVYIGDVEPRRCTVRLFFCDILDERFGFGRNAEERLRMLYI